MLLGALSVIVVLCDILVLPFGALVMTYLHGDAVVAARQSDDDAVHVAPSPV